MPKTRFAAVLAAVAVLGALVACGPAEGDGPVSSWLTGDSSTTQERDGDRPAEEAPEPTCSAEETVPEAEALPVENYDADAALGDC
ncbi:hypothetical protein ABT352_33125 [Streptosporangium sp. NPDC000563]|uniref:hypothetical protein n=1 Tax=Streptosporangium sp. NPDC000563 TaxID=3154366 RepID=UPI00332E9AF1